MAPPVARTVGMATPLVRTDGTAPTVGRTGSRAGILPGLLVGALSAAAGAAPAGCGAGGPDSAAAFTVRDSAGIAIAESTGPAWRPGEAWRVDGQPALHIGVMEGDARYQFHRLRGAAQLTDGRIVVVDAGSADLRIFDAGGRHLATFGRAGDGPGEFRNPGRPVVLPGDSVAVYDSRLRRVSMFHPDAGFSRSLRIDLGEGLPPSGVGAFGDGSLLVSAWTIPDAVALGARRDTMEYFRLSADGEILTRFGRFPGSEIYVSTFEGNYSEGALMFGREPAVAVRGGRFHYGAADQYEILAFGVNGALDLRIRRDFRNLEVTRADIDEERRAWLEPNEGHEAFLRFLRRVLAEMPYPAIFPAYAAMVADADGNLWVEEYRRPGDDRPRWTVFDADGRMRGEVEMPAGLTVLEIGADYVLGRWRDDMDVDFVRLYRLLKP